MRRLKSVTKYHKIQNTKYNSILVGRHVQVQCLIIDYVPPRSLAPFNFSYCVYHFLIPSLYHLRFEERYSKRNLDDLTLSNMFLPSRSVYFVLHTIISEILLHAMIAFVCLKPAWRTIAREGSQLLSFAIVNHA